METIDDVFEAFGGTRKTADALSVKPSTASEMRRRASIPVKYWPQLIQAAKVNHIRGLSNDSLVRLHTGPYNERQHL